MKTSEITLAKEILNKAKENSNTIGETFRYLKSGSFSIKEIETLKKYMLSKEKGFYNAGIIAACNSFISKNI